MTTKALARVERVEGAPVGARRTDWQGVVGAWLEEVRQRTGSTRTPAEYAAHLRRFLGCAGLAENPAGATAAHVHACAYGRGATGREPSPSTVMVRLASIASFYDFARRMNLVQANPAARESVKRPKTPKPVPRGLTMAEFKRLLAAIPSTPSGARDRAILVTFAFTGLRRSEVMNLKAGDLTRNGHVSYTVRAKGGKTRTRELPAPAFAAIVEALEAEGRPLDTLKRTERVFDVSAQGFYLNLRRYAEKAGLEGVHPHALRHSAAKWRRETAASIEDVSSFLGHESIATTARYLKRLEGEGDEGWKGVAVALGL